MGPHRARFHAGDTILIMRVHIAADHAGYELKLHLIEALAENGHSVTDHGAFEFEAGDDYPVFCVAAGEAVVADPESVGVVIGGSGNGEQIAANKVTGVRAVLAWSVETAELGREHNNANVIAIGARMHSEAEATAIIDGFMNAQWRGEDRHERRVAMLKRYEQSGSLA